MRSNSVEAATVLSVPTPFQIELGQEALQTRLPNGRDWLLAIPDWLEEIPKPQLSCFISTHGPSPIRLKRFLSSNLYRFLGKIKEHPSHLSLSLLYKYYNYIFNLFNKRLLYNEFLRICIQWNVSHKNTSLVNLIKFISFCNNSVNN